jgi:hypothetical protein
MTPNYLLFQMAFLRSSRSETKLTVMPDWKLQRPLDSGLIFVSSPTLPFPVLADAAQRGPIHPLLIWHVCLLPPACLCKSHNH